MSTSENLLMIGVCPLCTERLLSHGPWTEGQIGEVCKDTGIAESDFVDCCDECLVTDVFHGDRAFAEKMLGYALKIPSPPRLQRVP